MRWLALLALLVPLCGAASAAVTPAGRILAAAGLDQRVGAWLPPDLTFRDERDRRVALGDFFDGRPVILAPVWYSCPNLCNVTLNGLVDSLRSIDFRAGRDFEVVAFSIDPRDGIDEAAALEAELLRQYDSPGAAHGWHLLTGGEDQIRRLAGQIGFSYRYDQRTGQYAHPATVVLITGQGRVSRYLPGVEFPPRDLRLALLEADQGELGSIVDEVLLRCFDYDPDTGRYSLAIINVMRILGSLTVAGIAAGLAVALIREHRKGAR